jgi:uncharacterized protein (DUF1330 family)
MSNATTLVVTASPNPSEPEAMQDYLKGVLPLLMGAGGQPVKRLKVTDAVGGTPGYGMVLVMNFESKDDVAAMFESEEYKALIPAREKGFTSMSINFADDM